MLSTIRERLAERLEEPAAAEYRAIAQKLDRFEATTYSRTVEGAQQATRDLVTIARELKLLDDECDQSWETLELEAFGRRHRPDPTAPINDSASGLQQLLAEYRPRQLPVGVDDMAAALDGIVERLAYRPLADDATTRQFLPKMVTTEARRLGVLPTRRTEANAFTDELVAYVNAWMV